MRLRLTEGLRRQVRRAPNDVATVFAGRRRTWREIADRSARLAAALQKIGMKPGDRIGMLALNTDRYLEYMLGVWHGGGALNPVNTRWSPAEVVFSLDDCDTEILIVDDHFSSWGEDLKARSRALKHVLHFGDSATPDGALDLEQWMREVEPADDALSGGDDLAGVFYTGGTTGFPKGVMLSHDSLASNAICNLLDVGFTEDEVVLAVAPIFHQAGMCILIRALICGCKTVYVDTFDVTKVLGAIADEGATFTLLVPTMLQRLIDDPQFSNFDVSNMRKVIYGASPINERLLERLLEAFPRVDFYQGYGMTETGGPYTTLPARCHRSSDPVDRGRLRSAGRPMWGMEIRIAHGDGAEAKTGEVGEITARGVSLMKGYWNRDNETRAAFREDWLRSGDMGYVDANGYLFIVDRLKDMIVTGGENVYSAEVENALTRHAAVASCAVIGIPSERWGEQVHAVVVLKPGAQATQTELRDHCKQFIAGYKCPASVEFRDALPTSAAGKLLKHVLREPFWKDKTRNVG